ncbi:MAG: hypothetical protein VXV96_02070 [Bdellovibrionota bacterium]|nr:hypothetical protein [Bdellovibrionota bacterium]
MNHLWIELKHLQQKDICPAKARIFHELILRKYYLRVIYRLITLPVLRTISLLLYYLIRASFLSRKKGVTLLFPLNKNEFKPLKRKVDDGIVSFGLSALFSPQTFATSFLRALSLTPRIHRYGLAHQHIPYYALLRSVELIAYYQFLNSIKSALTKVIVTTDGNPNGLALLAVAKKKRLLLYFLSHALPAPPYYQGYLGTVSPLDSLSAKIYQNHFHTKDINEPKIVIEDKMIKEPPQEIKTILICLSKSDDLSRIDSLYQLIKKRLPQVTLKTRFHPSSKNRQIDLKKDIHDCQLAIISNSSVFIDLTYFGVPCLYCDLLDPGFYDRYGFIKMGLLKDFRDF